MAIHSSILAWRIPWTEKPSRLQSTGSQSWTRLSDFTSPYCILDSFIDYDGYSIIAVHGSDHELLIAKFRLKLKKVGKTTRPFRYDLNQVPYDYTVEVTNGFKGLDLIECLKNYGQKFVTLYRRQ